MSAACDNVGSRHQLDYRTPVRPCALAGGRFFKVGQRTPCRPRERRPRSNIIGVKALRTPTSSSNPATPTPGPCRHPCQHEAGNHGTQLFTGQEPEVSVLLKMIFGQVRVPSLALLGLICRYIFVRRPYRGISGIGLYPARGVVAAAVSLEVVQYLLPPIRGGLARRHYRAPVSGNEHKGGGRAPLWADSCARPRSSRGVAPCHPDHDSGHDPTPTGHRYSSLLQFIFRRRGRCSSPARCPPSRRRP